MRKNADYPVGYRKPPVHTRFRRGQSGNPNGRPKGTNNLKTDLLEELNERVPVTVGGKVRRFSKQRLTIKSIVAHAAKGDIRAATKVFELYLKVTAGDELKPQDSELSGTDQEILAAFLQRHSGQP